jgi:serine/threonine protein kinase/Tfp pilus assembly protein PilF
MNANDGHPEELPEQIGHADPTDQIGPDDPRVFAALEEYEQACKAGRQPEQTAFLNRHRDVADVLAPLLATRNIVHTIGQELCQQAEDLPSPSGLRPPSPPRCLGDFQLLRVIGRGGMGVVHEAFQVSLQRKVALKELPIVSSLVPKQLPRFRNEILAAAGLQHDNIVQVYQHGEHDGVHYYVMQLIEGPSLATVIEGLRASADAAESLHEPARDGSGPDERSSTTRRPTFSVMALSTQRSAHLPEFCKTVAQWCVQAANALDYAHQVSIIHRDVKPSNLLVDGNGKLWVTDFGLARIPGGNLTMSGEMLGTLRYSSPEQAFARHREVGPRADVYSLGATLFELLTLEPACPGVTREEILSHKSDDPLLARRVNPQIPKDLETIVMKAMAPRPEDRFASAQEMAEDLQRFLDDEPIRARRLTWAQRALRWGWKHRPVVVTAALGVLSVLIAAIAAVVILAFMVREVRVEQAKTAQARDDAHQVVSELTEVGESLADEPHVQEKTHQLLRIALRFYQEQARRNPITPEEELKTAIAHRKVADIEGVLGQHEDAERAYRQAIAILKKLASQLPEVSAARQELARAHNNFGNLLSTTGKLDEAEQQLVLARDLHLQLVRDHGNREPVHKKEAASTSTNLGTLQHKRGHPKEARVAYDSAITLQQSLVERFPDAVYRRELAVTYVNRATLSESEGRFEDAEHDTREAMNLQQKLVVAHTRKPVYRRDLAATLNNLGKLLRKMGRRPEALKAYWEAQKIQAALASDFAATLQYRLELSRTLLNLGQLLFEDGDVPQATTLNDQGLGELEKLVATFPALPAFSLELARGLNHRGQMLAHVGKREEAQTAYCQAQCLLGGLTQDHPTVPEYTQELACCHHSLGLLALAEGRLEDAVEEFQEAQKLYDKLLTDDHDNPEYARGLANAQMSLANALKATGKQEEAAITYREAQRRAEKLERRFKDVPAYLHLDAMIHQNLGNLLADLGQWDQAEASLRKSADRFDKLTARFDKVTAYRQAHGITCNSHGHVLTKLGRLAEAIKTYDKAIDVQKSLADHNPAVSDYRWHLAQTVLNKGVLLESLGRFKEAKAALDRAYDLLRKLAATSPENARYRLDLARVQGNRANVFVLLGMLAESRAAFDEQLQILERLVKEFPDSFEYRVELGRACCNGHRQRATRPLKDVEKVYRRGISLQADLVERFPKSPSYRYELACNKINLGVLLTAIGQLSDGAKCYVEAIALLRELAKEKEAPHHRESLAIALHNLGLVEARREGGSADAVRAFTESIDLREALVARCPEVVEYRGNLCGTISELTALLLRRGEAKQARRFFEKARDLLQQGVKLNPSDPETHNNAAWFFATCPDLLVRDAKEAVRLAEQAIELAQKKGTAVGTYWNTLGVAHYRCNEWEKAAKALEQSISLQGDNAYDYFFLAMARWQQHDKVKARKHFDRGIELMKKMPANVELLGFRREAETLLESTR